MAKSSGAAGFQPQEEVVDPGFEALPLDEVIVSECSLAELNKTLPVGIFDSDGNRLQDIELAPYTGELETTLEELFDSNRQGVDKVTFAVREFLPKAVKAIGGKAPKDLNSDPRRLFESMPLGDVLALILQIRIDYQESTDISIRAECPRCGAVNLDKGTYAQPYHDLSSIGVKYYPHLTSKPVFRLDLEDGFDVVKDKAKTLLFSPLRFYHLKQMAAPAAKGDKKFANLNLLSCVIVGMPGVEAYQNVRGNFFDRNLYTRMIESKRDKKRVFSCLEKLQPGPVMEVQCDCVQCQNRWKEGIPWVALPSFLYGPLMPAQE